MKTLMIIILTSLVVIIAVATLNFASYSDKNFNKKPLRDALTKKISKKN